MKKCRLTYDEWKSMKKKRRYGVDAHTSDFNGYELDEALKTNDISEEQYQRALSTAEKLQNGLLSDYKKYEVFIAKMLKITGSK